MSDQAEQRIFAADAVTVHKTGGSGGAVATLPGQIA